MTTYRAIMLIQTPTGAFSDGVRCTTGVTVTLPMVPSAGTFYNTKAVLESAYGVGSVQALYENT